MPDLIANYVGPAMRTSPAILGRLAAHCDGAHQTTRLAGVVNNPIQAARLLTRIDDLSGFRPEDLHATHDLFPVSFLNLGGGPTFLYPLWANLDSAVGPLHPAPFRFAADTVLPFDDGALEIVYSSHALEHLESAVVDRLLAEARRTLNPAGALVIKIPDYQRVIAAWRNQDARFLSADTWGFGALALDTRGVADTLATRAAYIFCGFWNAAYGDVFAARDRDAPGAYNGPAVIPQGEIEAILNGGKPSDIAAAFRAQVVGSESDYTFNHQTAWDRQEFVATLERAGFDVICTDDSLIVERYNHIPRLREMQEISSYFVAFPR